MLTLQRKSQLNIKTTQYCNDQFVEREHRMNYAATYHVSAAPSSYKEDVSCYYKANLAQID